MYERPEFGRIKTIKKLKQSAEFITYTTKTIIQNILNKQKTYLSNSFTAAPVVSRDHIFHVSLPTPMKLELHNNPHDPHPGLKTNKPKLTKQTAATPNKLSCDTSKKKERRGNVYYIYIPRGFDQL